jgi:ABC-type Fe3+ transport system substrate-binding protein
MLNVYWANLCILNRMEGEKMEAAGDCWSQSGRGPAPKMIYLGDTAEVGMYEKVSADISSGELGFDMLVSTRFDLFCSSRYLAPFKDDFLTLRGQLPIRSEIEEKGIMDREGKFYPLVLLPHYMVVNSHLLDKMDFPGSLKELLDPRWKGKVFLGSTDLPSAKSVLFSIWYLYGNEGLESCVKNWRQRSAPSAARHGLVKDEFPVALLPGVFSGTGPMDKLIQITPIEGSPLLPSYAVVRKSSSQDRTLHFLKNSVGTREFIEFYRDQAMAYPVHPEVGIPADWSGTDSMLFPPWEWIEKQDMGYFEGMCRRMPEA